MGIKYLVQSCLQIPGGDPRGVLIHRDADAGVCEHLPLLAARSEKWSMIRSLTTPYNGHSEGHMAILSGRTPLPTGFSGVKPQPGDWPSIASVAGAALPPRTNNLPPAVVLPERLIHRTGRVIQGQFGGIMGSRRDPWFTDASPFNATSYGAYPDYEFSSAPNTVRTKRVPRYCDCVLPYVGN